MGESSKQLMVSGSVVQQAANGSQVKVGHYHSQTMSPSPDRKMILWNEYEVEELIGGGSFGHVYSCRHLKTGKYYAVKKFKTKF